MLATERGAADFLLSQPTAFAGTEDHRTSWRVLIAGRGRERFVELKDTKPIVSPPFCLADFQHPHLGRKARRLYPRFLGDAIPSVWRLCYRWSQSPHVGPPISMCTRFRISLTA